MKDKIENNIIISNNNDKYVDNINTINQFNFTSIYDCFIKDSEKINRKYHLSLGDIIVNGANLFFEYIMNAFIGSIKHFSDKLILIYKNIKGISIANYVLILCQLVIDSVSLIILLQIDSNNFYNNLYYELLNSNIYEKK